MINWNYQIYSYVSSFVDYSVKHVEVWNASNVDFIKDFDVSNVTIQI